MNVDTSKRALERFLTIWEWKWGALFPIALSERMSDSLLAKITKLYKSILKIQICSNAKRRDLIRFGSDSEPSDVSLPKIGRANSAKPFLRQFYYENKGWLQVELTTSEKLLLTNLSKNSSKTNTQLSNCKAIENKNWNNNELRTIIHHLCTTTSALTLDLQHLQEAVRNLI